MLALLNQSIIFRGAKKAWCLANSKTCISNTVKNHEYLDTQNIFLYWQTSM